MKKLRLLLITLCVTALMGSMAVTAYAGGCLLYTSDAADE